jgi:protein phosphatase 2C family protein 2/3
MGCFHSKKSLTVVPPEGADGSPAGGSTISPHRPGEDGLGRLLPSSKRPPTMDEARSSNEVRNPRLSVKYQAKELSNRGPSRRSSTPFDRARIGTHTRHGLMPGPRGFSAAKINQDRGVVCWPFNGSYNQALLCVFDGHGSKGERASEYCMRTIPELLEQDRSLKTKPMEVISKAVIKTDEMLLGSPELGRLAMTCGTTSTVVYFNGSDCYTACSGDSRAVKGLRRNGQVAAEDLSNDHKPDLPEERKRIEAAGGTVSEGTAGRPSRVWAHGRIGLAMSRSIGDGECKHVGVIPDPEVLHTTVSPAPSAGADGDLFVIVASDGVWEFITSDEACALVHKHENASDACSALVMEAALRWRRFEGSYRDDITAIVAFVPFLEDEWPEEEEEEEADHERVYLNMGTQGLSWNESARAEQAAGAATSAADDEQQQEAEEGEEEGEEGEAKQDFAARRLSVHNPYDEDWNEMGEEGGEEDAKPK